MAKTQEKGGCRRRCRERRMRKNDGMLYSDLALPVVQGCTKISPGCKRCMAEQSIGHVRGWKKNGGKPFRSIIIDRKVLGMPLRCKKPYRIFFAPHGDLFHEEVPYPVVRECLIVANVTPQHVYLMLTKRPERMKEYLAIAALEGLWPLPNVNIGVSTENQEWYDRRVPILISIPVHDLAYRWVACEPLLGPIELGVYGHHIGWLVYGQERAVGRRPMKREWGAALEKECGELHIPFYRHRSHKPWKLNLVKQQRRQQEEAMKIELLKKLPPDVTPNLVLSEDLLDSVEAISVNGMVIVFTKPGEMGDQPVAVPINAPTKAMHKSPFEQKESVSEAKPKKVKKEKRKATVKDVAQILKKNFDTKTEMSDQIGITVTTLTKILERRPVTEITRQKLELFLSKHYDEPCIFEAEIRAYPGNQGG